MKSSTKSKSPRKPPKPRVERTRNGGTETQSQHMGKIRSALRNLSRWWKPFGKALSASAHISYYGKKKRVSYLCAKCSKLYSRPDVEVNHIVPVGSLKSYEDLHGFCSRLFVEDHTLLEVVCRTCHISITKEQKGGADLNC